MHSHMFAPILTGYNITAGLSLSVRPGWKRQSWSQERKHCHHLKLPLNSLYTRPPRMLSYFHVHSSLISSPVPRLVSLCRCHSRCVSSTIYLPHLAAFPVIHTVLCFSPFTAASSCCHTCTLSTFLFPSPVLSPYSLLYLSLCAYISADLAGHA